MITKKVLNADRIRRIDGGFSFIPHRFLADGFLASLQQQRTALVRIFGAGSRSLWALILQL